MATISRNLKAVLALGAVTAFFFAYSTLAKSKKELGLAEGEAGPAFVLTDRSGGVAIATELELYASGTAVLKTWMGERLVEEESSLVEYDVLAELLSAVAAGRLLEFDETRIGEQLRALSGSADPMAPSDSSVLIVKLKIEETSDNGLREVREKEIVIQAPETLARRFPSIREYQALARLKAVLTSYQSARRGQS